MIIKYEPYDLKFTDRIPGEPINIDLIQKADEFYKQLSRSNKYKNANDKL